MISALILSTVLAISAAPDAKIDPPLVAVEQNLLAKTNEARARHKLPPLEIDPSVQSTCRQHCAWMTNRRSMTHGHYNVAENIAHGQSSSTEVVDCWMNSSGHRANILNPRHRFIGVAGYRSSNGIYWCQQFR